jgi:hypothetical protein
MSKAALKRAVSIAAGHFTAEVFSVSADNTADVDMQGVLRQSLPLATHLTAVQTGQKVLVWLDSDGSGLIVAAWPAPGLSKPISYEVATGTLRIEAPRLELQGVSHIELVCGAARVMLSLDGHVQLEGQDILSTAVGRNRVEGGSIDLN